MEVVRCVMEVVRVCDDVHYPYGSVHLCPTAPYIFSRP